MRSNSLRGAQPVRTNVTRLALDLLFDPGDPDFEKLVQIRTDDREKLDPLDQRLCLVLRFFENAAVELEPAQLAVDEIFRVAKTLMRGLHDLRSGNRAGFLFGSCSSWLPASLNDRQSTAHTQRLLLRQRPRQSDA